MRFLICFVKLINNSRGKYKRNTYLINICKSDTDFVLIYISFKFSQEISLISVRLLRNMNIFILTFHKYDKAFASDLYLIYNRSPAARVCKSDTDRLLMLYLVHTILCYTINGYKIKIHR